MRTITAARMEALRERTRVLPEGPVLARLYSEMVQSRGRKVEVGVLDPSLVGIVVKNQKDPDGEGGPLCMLMSLEQAEEMARDILGIDPPLDQQILEELRELRRDLREGDGR